MNLRANVTLPNCFEQIELLDIGPPPYNTIPMTSLKIGFQELDDSILTFSPSSPLIYFFIKCLNQINYQVELNKNIELNIFQSL